MELQGWQVYKVGEHQQSNKVPERQQSMKSKSNGCGHESKEYGKGKNGKKGYVEIEIKMSRAPKKKAKRK